MLVSENGIAFNVTGSKSWRTMPEKKMIDSRAAGGTEKRQRPPSLLQSVGRLVHIGGLLTACRLADVVVHARQSGKRCETQCRHAAAPSSRERSPPA
eukprot:366070-Chlamydomonas_euryale.AAC.4